MGARVTRAFTPVFDGLCLRMTPRMRNAHFRFTDSNFKQPWDIARILWSAPGRPSRELQYLAPSRGAERRQTRGSAKPPMGGRRKPPGGTLCEGVPSPPKKRGASRRSTCGVSHDGGPRFHERGPATRPSASSWRRVIVPGSGAPPSPGELECVAPAPRRRIDRRQGFPPLIDPVSSEPNLQPVPHRCSVFTASHDDAPQRAGHKDYIQRRGPVNSPV